MFDSIVNSTLVMAALGWLLLNSITLGTRLTKVETKLDSVLTYIEKKGSNAK